jgi:hypothetical protein
MVASKNVLEAFRLIGFLLFFLGILGFVNSKGGNSTLVILGIGSSVIALLVTFSYLALYKYLPIEGARKNNRRYFQPYLLLSTIIIMFFVAMYLVLQFE